MTRASRRWAGAGRRQGATTRPLARTVAGRGQAAAGGVRVAAQEGNISPIACVARAQPGSEITQRTRPATGASVGRGTTSRTTRRGRGTMEVEDKEQRTTTSRKREAMWQRRRAPVEGHWERGCSWPPFVRLTACTPTTPRNNMHTAAQNLHRIKLLLQRLFI